MVRLISLTLLFISSIGYASDEAWEFAYVSQNEAAGWITVEGRAEIIMQGSNVTIHARKYKKTDDSGKSLANNDSYTFKGKIDNQGKISLKLDFHARIPLYIISGTYYSSSYKANFGQGDVLMKHETIILSDAYNIFAFSRKVEEK